MTQKEQARLQVLNNLLAGHTTLDQAATLMGVTTRHTRRILAAYREKGVRELGIHRATIKKYLVPCPAIFDKYKKVYNQGIL